MTNMLVFSVIMNITAMYMKHPLSLGSCLMIQTILYSLMTGIISSNFWFSYILFLMMISGMLILFMYMTSVTSNNKFSFSKLMMMPLLMISPMMILIMNSYNYTFMIPNYAQIINNIINNFFNFPLINMMMLMMIYLLLILIATVKIINIKSGPLRQKF